MSENEILGGIESAAGRVERSFGEATGNRKTQVEGLARQAKGEARQTAGRVKVAVDKARHELSDRMGRLGDQTKVAYARTSAQVRKVADRVDPIVRERPYSAAGASLGLGLAVGVLIGMMLAANSQKVIYVDRR